MPTHKGETKMSRPTRDNAQTSGIHSFEKASPRAAPGKFMPRLPKGHLRTAHTVTSGIHGSKPPPKPHLAHPCQGCQRHLRTAPRKAVTTSLEHNKKHSLLQRHKGPNRPIKLETMLHATPSVLLSATTGLILSQQDRCKKALLKRRRRQELSQV
eukprot:TRINITY_DN2002_c0_g1_i5.p1 TRINITY_DN2002_c0_g1~~TRINITY_DN2002_c0_g1_i5.p1  ORF type:complete len:155 (-),score=0.58 TRINITY_DN2002_c0_g1_i5:1479-1943(-)